MLDCNKIVLCNKILYCVVFNWPTSYSGRFSLNNRSVKRERERGGGGGGGGRECVCVCWHLRRHFIIKQPHTFQPITVQNGVSYNPSGCAKTDKSREFSLPCVSLLQPGSCPDCLPLVPPKFYFHPANNTVWRAAMKFLFWKMGSSAPCPNYQHK